MAFTPIELQEIRDEVQSYLSDNTRKVSQLPAHTSLPEVELIGYEESAPIKVSFPSLVNAVAEALDLEPIDPGGPGERLPGVRYQGTYTPNARISHYLQSDIVIDGLEINGDLTVSNGGACIDLRDCTNITIKNCKFTLSTFKPAIYVSGCSNITIVDCSFEDVFAAVWVSTCTNGIVIENNDCYNVLGTLLTGGGDLGQFVQFQGTYGSGHSISYNVVQHDIGMAYPEDNINIFGAGGVSGSIFKIEHNFIRGGSSSASGGGIVIGDEGGSYSVIGHNTLINPGQYGVAIVAGTDMTIEENTVWAGQNFYINAGLLAIWYGSGTTPSQIKLRNNTSGFIQLDGNNNWIYLDNSMTPYISENTNNVMLPQMDGLALENSYKSQNMFGRLTYGKTSGVYYANTSPYNRTEWDLNAAHISGTTMNAPAWKSSARVVRVQHGVTSLAANALGGTSSSSNLWWIVLPSTITSIGNNGLRYNSQLKELIIHATTPPTLGTNALGNMPATTKIRVPRESYTAYTTATGWSALASQIFVI